MPQQSSWNAWMRTNGVYFALLVFLIAFPFILGAWGSNDHARRIRALAGRFH